MRSDSDIERDVELELKWDVDIDSKDIAVAVKDGVVTLTGFLRGYAQKWQAERDAKRVAGVLAVANERNRAVLGRTAGGRACGMARALRHESGNPHHDRSIHIQLG